MSDASVNLKIPGIGQERLIRRGDHTVLYRAVQEQFNREVAIKSFTAEGVRETALERFHRECQVMGELSAHPHIVTFFDSGVRKREPYVVGEWLVHGTLFDQLANGQLDWRETLDVGIKLCGALETSHRAGILHRKLKPQDVFLSAFGEPLLGDFRLDPSDESRSGDPFDILVHEAPELSQSTNEASVVSDVYSLTSVLFTLLRGLPPFVEDETEPLVRIKGRALTQPPPDLRGSGVPAVVYGTLVWGLAPAPENRPQTAQDLGRALQAAQQATGEAQTRLHIRPRTEADRTLPDPTVSAAAMRPIMGDTASPASAPAPPPPAAPAPPTASAPPPPTTAPAPAAPAPPPPATSAPPPPPTTPAAPAPPPPATSAPPPPPTTPAAPAPPPPATSAPPPPPTTPAAPAPPPSATSAPPPPPTTPAAPAPPTSPAPPPPTAPAPPTAPEEVAAPAVGRAPITHVPVAEAAPRKSLAMPENVVEAVRELVHKALNSYRNTDAFERIEELERRLDEPLRVAVAGKVKAGKSTLLNGLVGQQLAPTDAGECTKIVTWYTNGLTYRAFLHPHGSEPEEARITRPSGSIEVELAGRSAADVEKIVVEWPSSALAEMTLIDTPGIASISQDVSSRTVEFMTASTDHEGQADAVIYLMRHFHPSDVRFLEAFHDDELAKPNPINAIGVLSRADELGDGGEHSMEDAHRIAKRYRSDPKIRRLCQTVVPVAGLLAEAGAILQQSDYNLLERLAGLPEQQLAILCASVDRFTDTDLVGMVTGHDREHLLGRLGLHGVRFAIGLIASGEVTHAPDLSQRLIEESGLSALRNLLISQFAGRRDVLKARAALQSLDHLLRTSPPPDGGRELAYELERIRAGAHVFAQIQLFAAFRAGAVDFRPDEQSEVERLLGAQGFAPTARLGLATDASEDDLRAALHDTVRRWQLRAESPLSTREQSDAARTLSQVCEGILAGMS